MKDQDGSFLWQLFFSELVGTALLVLVGLSLVTVMFGSGSPMTRFLPSEGLSRLITGFLFGTTGALIAGSAIGKVSGAQSAHHLNRTGAILAKRIEVAKLHYFDSERDWLLRRKGYRW